MTYSLKYSKIIKHGRNILIGGIIMAKKATEKKPLFGNRRSHSLRATRHAQKPNLQNVTLENGEKVVMSAREIRTLRKNANKEVESE